MVIKAISKYLVLLNLYYYIFLETSEHKDYFFMIHNYNNEVINANCCNESVKRDVTFKN